jgi:hypothetical protein
VVSDFSPGMAVHVVRIRVDEDTGRVVPLNYVAVQDVGTAINPATVDGQMEWSALRCCPHPVRDPLSDHDAGEVDVGARDGRHHRSIDHT